eukprot:UN24832
MKNLNLYYSGGWGYGILEPLYWYRLCGAKIDFPAEVHRCIGLPENWHWKSGATCTSELYIGQPYVRAGKIYNASITIGRETFIGNKSLLKPGCSVGDHCLLGVRTWVEKQFIPDNTSWVGSPAVKMPARTNYRDSWTGKDQYNVGRTTILGLGCFSFLHDIVL